MTWQTISMYMNHFEYKLSVQCSVVRCQ